MAISVRTRFEVFKRDDFTCRYCGRRPPEVLLEADHVLPKAAGGTDDIENLTTACWECNHGKADKLLVEGGPAVDQRAVDDIRAAAEERLAQAAAYAAAIESRRDAEALLHDMVLEAWADGFGAEKTETGWSFRGTYGRWPEERSITNFIRRLPLDVIIEAVDRTVARFAGRSNAGACLYFYKVCWNKVAERDVEAKMAEDEAVS